ncbi:hypothetical protein SAMN05443245_4577 [Paraburkholderia fungorum]|uniref:Uncharacterized protein n=1 Tax=Paraburkholderia fungorum TaxID=134537 RepID=A0A1H1I2K9_9BURK|nr:hypothetical protein [Paraburkholderia fungorum]SDR31900.1 hypothetical protein SAMN05443245_4577 [Paraburkholderia fungorum]
MNRTNRTSEAGSAIGALDRLSFNGNSGLSYRPHVGASRRLFAAPPVDLTTLVIAQEIKRKAQAELQREVLRDTAYRYDMPVQQERNDDRNNTRNDERGGWNNPADFDE